MSYLTQDHIAHSPAMQGRVAQAAASEGYAEPDNWMALHARTWAASPDWDAAWESALASHPDDPDYNPGTDEAVITDGMILSAVQTIGA